MRLATVPVEVRTRLAEAGTSDRYQLIRRRCRKMKIEHKAEGQWRLQQQSSRRQKATTAAAMAKSPWHMPR